MSPLVSLNGVETDEPSIGALTSAVLYGKGVFTTISIRHGRPFLWEKHWRRLTVNAERLSINLSTHTEKSTFEDLEKTVASCGIDVGRARVTFLDGSSSSIWSSRSERDNTDLLITVEESRSRPEYFNITTSPFRVNSTSPLAGVKSCNYLEHLMAYEEARRDGFDEAIRLNERGHVASACMANVFWEAGGKLFTPSLSTGCLPGTTREFVMENFECKEVEEAIEGLESADRIWLTSAGLGVAPVAEFDGKRLDTSEHPFLGLLPG